ncbi:MAG: hypothetical protein ACPGLY_08055 [Rubripirellula sp.]
MGRFVKSVTIKSERSTIVPMEPQARSQFLQLPVNLPLYGRNQKIGNLTAIGSARIDLAIGNSAQSLDSMQASHFSNARNQTRSFLRLLTTADEDAIPARNARPSVAKNTTDAIRQKPLIDKPTLQSLSLEKTTVTDTDLHLLKGLPLLKSIDLNTARATDIGMNHIRKLITLETLGLSDTPVTDAGLSQLANLSNLKSLLLDGSRISNIGLRHLKRLTNLETLSLSGSAISDQGSAI